MALVSTFDLQTYKGSQDDDELLLDIYINSAINIIEDYLGYTLASADYVLYLSGLDSDRILIPVYPVTEITSLTIDDVDYDIEDFTISGKWLISNDGSRVFTEGLNNIKVEFTAGYETAPELIKLTILRIATLLSLESEGNIGLTNKSFSDGSRTFINYTNFSKYLLPLNNLRIARF